MWGRPAALRNIQPAKDRRCSERARPRIRGANRIATYAPVAAAAIHQIGATRRQNAITERANKIGWAKTEAARRGEEEKCDART